MTILPDDFGASAGASVEDIEKAERALNASFPSDYKELLVAADGGEGWVGEHYLVLWRANDLATFNAEYEFPVFASALIGFGGDGGGEAFAFDTRHDPYKVVMVPLIGMSNENAIIVSDSFNSLIERMKTDDSLFD